MQREPGRRYATADAMALDIERHLNGETVSARPESLTYQLGKAIRRHWVGISAAGAVLVAILGSSGLAVVQAQRSARSVERERVVKEFVTDVFRVNSRIDPKNAVLRPASTQSLLEGGAKLIQQRFAGQPDIQAELFGVVGGVFSDMGAYKLAADYATKRVETLALLKADRMEQARALLALATAMHDDRRDPDAELRLRRAIELAEGDLTLQADILVTLVKVQDRLGPRAPREATLARLARAMTSGQLNGTPASAWLQYFRAEFATGAKSFEAEVMSSEPAINAAAMSQGSLSSTLIAMHLDFADRLVDDQKCVEVATRHHAQAINALHQLGGANEIRAALETAVYAGRRYTRAGSISGTEAIKVIERARSDLAASTLPIPEWFGPYIDFWLGLAKLTHGEVRAGVELIESSAPVLRIALDGPLDGWRVARGLGQAQMETGQHESATKALQEALAFRTSMDGQNHPFAVPDYLFIVDNLTMQGDLRGAAVALDRAPNYEAMTDTPETGTAFGRRVSSQRLLYRRARILLANNDAPMALELLTTLKHTYMQLGSSALRHFNATLGETLCAANRRDEGLQVLMPRLAQEERDDISPNAPGLARLRTVTGNCALATGDRAMALALAKKARAAFAEQPGVSPYYKAPLFKLERALGLRLPPV